MLLPKGVLPPLASDACRKKTPLKRDAVRRAAGQVPEFFDPHLTEVISHAGIVFSHAMWSMAVIGQREATTQFENHL